MIIRWLRALLDQIQTTADEARELVDEALKSTTPLQPAATAQPDVDDEFGRLMRANFTPQEDC